MSDEFTSDGTDSTINDESPQVSEQANDETYEVNNEVDDFNELSIEEQAATLDATDEPQETESSEGDDNGDEDLNVLYASQMEDADMKLDKPILVKYNGTVHKVDSVNELKSLAEQGISITKKSQRMSDQTNLLAELEANGYTADDLRQLATNDKGEELTKVEPKQIEIDTIATGILESNYADKFKSFVGELPGEAIDFISGDPRILKGLADDVESGLAARLQSATKRNMDLRGMPFLEAYISAGNDYDKTKQTKQTNKTAMASQPKQNNRPQPKQKDTSEMSIEELDAMIDKY